MKSTVLNPRRTLDWLFLYTQHKPKILQEWYSQEHTVYSYTLLEIKPYVASGNYPKFTTAQYVIRVRVAIIW